MSLAFAIVKAAIVVYAGRVIDARVVNGSCLVVETGRRMAPAACRLGQHGRLIVIDVVGCVVVYDPIHISNPYIYIVVSCCCRRPPLHRGRYYSSVYGIRTSWESLKRGLVNQYRENSILALRSERNLLEPRR